MPANIDPIYTRTADIQWTPVAATNNAALTGAGTLGTDIWAVFTADATEGGYISHVRAKPLGTNVATVARLFINNGGTNATTTNNTLVGEISLTATSASSSAALAEYAYPLNIALPPGYRVLVTLGTTVAAGWQFTGIGGKY